VKDEVNLLKKLFQHYIFFLCLCICLSLSVQIPDTYAEAAGKTVTILFTNDLHDHLLPAKDLQNGELYYSGGYARLLSAIAAERKIDPAALLLDGGDFSMGTPFQTIFKSDAPGLRLMGAMGYDAATLGNHEYDYRASGLAGSLTAAMRSGDQLPQLVQSNVIFPIEQSGKLTASLQALKQAYRDYGVKDYTILSRNGDKIGIFGLMGVDAADKAPMSEVEFAEPVAQAQRVVKILSEQEKVDLIICLSHSGTETDQTNPEDEVLAQKVPEIDVIISAHTHTRLAEPILIGRTIIGSAEENAKHLGVMKISQAPGQAWQLDSYRLQPIDDRLPGDPQLAGVIEGYKQLVQEKYFNQFGLRYDEVLAAAPFSFQPASQLAKKHQEDPLGNLISDAFIYAVQQAEGAGYVPVDASIVPVGTIRGSFFQGPITAADAFCVSSLGIGPDQVPGYPLLSVYLTGKELKAVCEVDASITALMDDAQLFMSGLNFTFNPRRLIFNKVTDTALERPDGMLAEIADEQLYRVVAGLYSAQMLSVVGDKSYGLLSIVPKTREGVPITDFEAQVIKDTAGGTGREVKEWLAVAGYLCSFAQVNGLPQVPLYYSGSHGRKLLDNNRSLPALLSRPNTLALVVYSLVLLLAALLLGIVYLLVKRKRRVNRISNQRPDIMS